MYLYRPIPRNAIKQSIFVELRDAASPFLPKTGFAYNAAGIVLSYALKRKARVAITPVDLAAVTTAWTSGGVKEIDSTNMPGVYRIDVPNAAFADDGSSDEVVISIKATGYESKNIRIPLTDVKDIRLQEATTKTAS